MWLIWPNMTCWQPIAPTGTFQLDITDKWLDYIMCACHLLIKQCLSVPLLKFVLLVVKLASDILFKFTGIVLKQTTFWYSFMKRWLAWFSHDNFPLDVWYIIYHCHIAWLITMHVQLKGIYIVRYIMNLTVIHRSYCHRPCHHHHYLTPYHCLSHQYLHSPFLPLPLRSHPATFLATILTTNTINSFTTNLAIATATIHDTALPLPLPPWQSTYSTSLWALCCGNCVAFCSQTLLG